MTMPDPLDIGLTDSGHFRLDPILLTKHCVVFGSTGAGKTVLCKSIVEEASMQGIPVLAIDPKGDISSLAVRSEDFDFRPFSNSEAQAKGVEADEYARQLAETYRQQLLERFNVGSDKVHRYISDVEVRIYTPRSVAGIPISLSPNLEPPPNFPGMLENDPTLAYELLELTSSTILKLIGYSDEDRMHLSFIAEILKTHWMKGQSLSLRKLVDGVMNPPFDKLGERSVEEFFSKKDRAEFNSRVNLLLIDPAIKSWFIGREIDFDRWFAKDPKTPVNVIDLRGIATETERQAFVEYLLEKLFLWMIRQEGAQALRYLLYFDEIYGYCPPVSSPASKKILLRLIKTSRAFGLGLILATQNPSDVDYKVISNANIRCIGRLPTEQDFRRIRAGLDLQEAVYSKISSLSTGEFVFHVFDTQTSTLVRPRWLISYHRGPLDYEEIRSLTHHQGREGDNVSEISESRTISIENSFPINFYPDRLRRIPVNNAKSKEDIPVLAFVGAFVARYAIDYAKVFQNFNQRATIRSEGLLAQSEQGESIDMKHKTGDPPVKNAPPFFNSHGQRFPTPEEDRLCNLIERYPVQRLSVEADGKRFRIQEAGGTPETKFDSVRGNTWLSSAYQKSIHLVGQRTTRTETIFPTSRSIRWHDANRVYLPVWTLQYEVDMNGVSKQISWLVSGVTGHTIASPGYPRCAGDQGGPHDMEFGQGTLQGCGHVTCNDHYRTCATCILQQCFSCSISVDCPGQHAFCNSHRLGCAICSKPSCAVCHGTKCGHSSCEEHRGQCSRCGNYYCQNCLHKKGWLGKAMVCKNCDPKAY